MYLYGRKISRSGFRGAVSYPVSWRFQGLGLRARFHGRFHGRFHRRFQGLAFKGRGFIPCAWRPGFMAGFMPGFIPACFMLQLFGKVAIGSLCMHMAQDTGRLSCTTTLTIRPVSVTPAGNLYHGTHPIPCLLLYSLVQHQCCSDRLADSDLARHLR